jgi:hypothetical protein
MKVMENQTPETRERLWRRKLSKTDRAELRGHPELELEAWLTDALAQLPDAPAPSNLTARVLNAIEFEEARAARAHGGHWNWRLLWPRVAVTAGVLAFALLGIQYHETGVRHVAMVKNLAQVTRADTVPDVEALNNFDVIQPMSQAGRADTELLAALQ